MTPVSKAPTATGEWECTECGYIVEGTAAQRPPHCPECDAPADALEFFANEDEIDDDWDEATDDGLDDDDFEDDEDYDDDPDEDDEFDNDDDY